MIIEVLPQNNCMDCVFCEEAIYCKLMDGEHIDYDYDNGREVASFCPFINPQMVSEMTNKVKFVKE